MSKVNSTILLLVIAFVFPAFAAEKIVLREDLAVYSSMNASATPKWRIRAGQTVLVNSKGKNGFRLVNGKAKGKTVSGYAWESDLEPYFSVSGTVNSMVGVSYVYSHLTQNDREIQTSDETSYNISQFSGTTQFFRLFYDTRLTPSLVVRGSLVKRETKSEGDAAVSGGTTTSHLILTQSLLGGQLEMLYTTGQFWVGGGLEISKGMAVNIETKSGPEISDEGLEKPFFTILSVGVGAYVGPVLSSFYIMPEMRYGAVVTTDPMTNLVELLLNVGYKLN